MGVCHCIKESPQCHFDILQQLKSATVHSKSSLREASSLPSRRGC